jgi:hypothetical protein
VYTQTHKKTIQRSVLINVARLSKKERKKRTSFYIVGVDDQNGSHNSCARRIEQKEQSAVIKNYDKQKTSQSYSILKPT